MPAFTAKYTHEQSEAVASAAIDRKMSQRRVQEMAAAGELVDEKGRKLDPFDIPLGTIGSKVRIARERRSGKRTGKLAQEEPRDAIEALRRRLVNLAEAMLIAEEKRKPETLDPERIRKIVRCVREAAALPGPKDERPHKPGTRVNGKQEEGPTRSKLARDLFDAHRAADGRAKPRNGQHADSQEQGTGAQQAQHDDDTEHEEAEDDGAPGSSARGLATPGLVPAT